MSSEPERGPESEKPRRKVYVDEKDFEAILDPIARAAAIEAELGRQQAAPDRPLVWLRRGNLLFSPWIKRKSGVVLDVGSLEFQVTRLEGGFNLLRTRPRA